MDDTTSRVRCRYIVKTPYENVVVDIMPTENVAMGFKNRWYPEGFKNSIEYPIAENKFVKILAAPYLIATKLEAFKTRGRNNGIISKDFEDIVYVLENRDVIWDEFRQANADVKNYLKEEFRRLMDSEDFEEWIDYHFLFRSPTPTLLILNQLKNFASRG